MDTVNQVGRKTHKVGREILPSVLGERKKIQLRENGSETVSITTD